MFTQVSDSEVTVERLLNSSNIIIKRYMRVEKSTHCDVFRHFLRLKSESKAKAKRFLVQQMSVSNVIHKTEKKLNDSPESNHWFQQNQVIF